MNHRRAPLLLAALLALTAADGGRRLSDRLFVSPMGEPFRGEGGRPALIALWFAGADTDHDGKLSPAEFRADAARFFLTLDLDHDGEIDPQELEHYERDVTSEGGSGASYGNGSSSFEPLQGAARFGMLDLPEPVAAADADFNRGVSKPEFLRAADQRFRALDFNHRGALILAELPERPPRIQRQRESAPEQSSGE